MLLCSNFFSNGYKTSGNVSTSGTKMLNLPYISWIVFICASSIGELDKNTLMTSMPFSSPQELLHVYRRSHFVRSWMQPVLHRKKQWETFALLFVLISFLSFGESHSHLGYPLLVQETLWKGLNQITNLWTTRLCWNSSADLFLMHRLYLPKTPQFDVGLERTLRLHEIGQCLFRFVHLVKHASRTIH